MALPLKPIALMGCLTGVTCTIGIPLSLSSQEQALTSPVKVNQDMNNNYLNTQQTNFQIGTLNSQDQPLSEDEEDFDEDSLTFEELLNNIFEDQLPGKDNVSKALQNSLNSDTKGNILTKNIESCKGTIFNKQNFCDFLELKNSKGEKYKLKFSREDQVKVVIVKSSDATIEYWDSNTNQGKKSDINFESLNSSVSSNSEGGQKLNEMLSFASR